MASVWEELKRRNVVRVAVAYAIVAWLLIQVAATVLPVFQAPDWIARVFTFFVVLGFPVAVVLSWAYELTPDGVERTSSVPASESITRYTGRKLELITVAALVLAFMVTVFNYETSGPFAPGSAVVADVETAAPPAPSAEEQQEVLPNSIAVLPFENLSLDAENAFFAVGIHEETLNHLAKLSKLSVISRTSVLRYADSDLSIPEIARELNVGTVMEGSVRYANNRVRITAQLIDAATDEHLWSEAYERDFADIFAIQADIAMNIANALKAEFSLEEQASIEKVPTDSPEAHARILQVVALLPPNSVEKVKRMIALATEAIELDPDYAEAYGHLALLYTDLMISGEGDRAQLERLAHETIDRALELNPDLHFGHRALAVLASLRSQWGEARDHYERALSSSSIVPANARNGLTMLYVLFGDYEQAIQVQQTNIELNPSTFNTRWTLAMALHASGRFDAAAKVWRQVIAANPANFSNHASLASSEIGRGDFAAAKREVRLAEQLLDEQTIDSDKLWVAYNHSKSGNQSDAERLIAEYRISESGELNIPEDELYIALIRSDEREIRRWLPEVIKPGAYQGQLVGLKVLSASDPALQIPLFDELFEEIGL
jgi:TolB-like protein/Tfp pilus assembly protein PilF